MSASAASLISGDEPVVSPVPRRSLGGWIWGVFVITVFAVALTMFPPLPNAGTPVDTPKIAQMFGRFHPIAVHGPVGMLFLAALMDVLAIRRGPLAEAIKPAITFTMGVGAFAAVIAVIFGLLLSREGGYDTPVFRAHQVLGITTAVLAILSYVCKLISDGTGRYAFLHRFVMVSTLAILSVGAHLGANMVYGSNYLTAFAPDSVRNGTKKFESTLLSFFGGPKGDAPASHGNIPPVIAGGENDSATVYASLIAPLMESKCNSCHNEDKQKGELRLDTHENMLKGGENGDNLVPGDPGKSLMIARMQLPIDDEDGEHMPPDGKPQPPRKKSNFSLGG
jgi:uncharacterized membrane protein